LLFACRFHDGWNLTAIFALVVGILPACPGLLQTVGLLSGLPSFWMHLYDYAIFLGFFISGGIFTAMMPRDAQHTS
jgi:NCS1 family nucleobase:cation symporter-1